MRNTVIISFLFFIMIFCVYIWESDATKLLRGIERTVNDIEIQFNNNDYEGATNTSNELYAFWQSKVKYLDMILNHSDTNVLTEEILKLTQYSQEKADADGLASVHYIKCMVKRIMNQQRVNIENIL